jgi:hypothetical protein
VLQVPSVTEPFLITGLPRSRTAWMAVAALNDQSICWHEPLAWLKQWEGALDLWRSSAHRYVGISDSALGFHLPEIIARASPRVLVIERDIAEVKASGAALGIGPSNYLTLLKAALVIDHPLIVRVPYDALTDDRVVASCLRHLMPRADIHMDRIKVLQRMNIQTDMERVNRDAPHADVAAILGPEIAAQLRAA